MFVMDEICNFVVPLAPPTVYYIPNFITEEEELSILNKVYAVPKPKWTCLSNRRLQDYGGVPHKNGMIIEKTPFWLQMFMDKLTHFKLFGNNNANHVLINEYLPGQGIMPHGDGPLFYPTITTISCGSSTILKFFNDDRENVCDLLLEPRSLVVLQDDMYTKYLHSIREITEEEITNSCVNLKECLGNYSIGDVLKRETRISLTIRNVPKVCKLKLWNL